MNKLEISHFKDNEPKETIKRIREILWNLDCKVLEELHDDNKGIFSAHIRIDDTGIYSNGKGVTPELALASGYGELMERLQNLLNFRIPSVFHKEVKNNKLTVVPDEIIKDIRTISIDNKWLKTLFDEKKQRRILRLLRTYSSDKVVMIPFREYGKKDIIEIPYVLQDVIYGSNGMAAGNTEDEAAVQGLCEIFERHVTKKLVKVEQLHGRFREITASISEKYPWANEAINTINEAGYDLHVLDLSEIENTPVVAGIFIDKETSRYSVNIASHPALNIAIERTITEALQGRKLSEMTGMTDISKHQEALPESANLNNIFATGEGIYPFKTFDFIKSEPSVNWNRNYNTSREMKEACIELIYELGYKLYYRDMSYLGFPSYHFIVPGMSEITLSSQEVEDFFEINMISDELQNIEGITKEKAKKIIKFLKNRSSIYRLSLYDILQTPTPSDKPDVLKDITLELLMMMLCAFCEDYEDGAIYAERYVEYLSGEKAASSIIKYYSTILSIFRMKSKHCKDDEIVRILSVFSDEEYAKEVLDNVSPKHVFDYFPRITCPDCLRCSVRENCLHEGEKNLYLKILRKAKAN